MNDSKNQSESQTLPLFSVYVIWCNKTNMHYIGITKQKVRRRIRQHRRGKKQLIDRKIQKLGWEGNFDWWLVEEHIPADQISEREQYWVATFDSVYPNGYNKTCGGISKLTVSDDTREILRQNALARDLSGENNPNFGKKHTDESREIIRQARVGKPPWNKGITCSEEQKAVLREKALERDISGENNPFFGKHHTEEAKEKIVKHISANLVVKVFRVLRKQKLNFARKHSKEMLAAKTILSSANTTRKNLKKKIVKRNSEERPGIKVRK